METFTIDDSTPGAELIKRARVYGIRLDVSQMSDLSRLPEEIAAALYTDAESLDAPKLRSATMIYAPNAAKVNLPQLTEVAVIYANAATSFFAPRLRMFGHIFIFHATTVSLP